jgi:hypothetical protein
MGSDLKIELSAILGHDKSSGTANSPLACPIDAMGSLGQPRDVDAFSALDFECHFLILELFIKVVP